MKLIKGTKVLINIGLCCNCTENDTFDFCSDGEECNRTRICDLDETDLELDIVIGYNEFSDTNETECHKILEDYEFIVKKKTNLYQKSFDKQMGNPMEQLNNLTK